MILTPGAQIGPYEVIARVGAGGMGEVWKARDPRLGRDVAIKALPNAFAADSDRLHRFQQEAHAIAALNHPHICQIYDIGSDYLVLEFVDGVPLSGPMPAGEAVRLAIQIAGAIDAAHRQGILHRDLKPANILVTRPGGGSLDPPLAKLLDFGLAKFVDQSVDVTRTAAGTLMGTAAYMSPEQAEGKPLDARSDIFSFGAVLYEMLSGTRAFAGETPARVLSAILRDSPPPFTTPPAIEQIVRRCLEKQPDNRFQTMADVRTALDGAQRQGSAGREEARPSIAVLAFANMSADPENEYFSDGLAEEIINALTHVPGLKVIARTSAFAFKGRHEDIRRIADVLGVAHVLEGSVRRAGNRIRVTAQLIAAADGSHLWSERYDREMADVFAIQDDISQAIAGALQVTLAVRPTGSQHMPKLPAYEAVLKGRHHMLRHSPVSLARANDCFEQAMALDPQYAEPHAYLGLNYFLSAMFGVRSMRETMPLVRAEAKEALSLDPTDPGPHFLLASVAAAYEYDWNSAAEHFATGMTGTSISAEAHWAYASLYLQPFGRFEESVSHMARSVERDPLNSFFRGVLASHLTHAGLHDQAIRQANEALEIDAINIVPYITLGEAYVATKRWPDAIAVLEKAHSLDPTEGMNSGMLAAALRQVGAHARADELIRAMGDTPRPLIGRVLYHWLCGETDKAADWYERSINARDPFALVFADGPLGSDFRKSSHWPKLATMMNFPA